MKLLMRAKDIARDEADKIKHAATADIDQQVNSAREQLRKEVSVIALAGVEQILQTRSQCRYACCGTR